MLDIYLTLKYLGSQNSDFKSLDRARPKSNQVMMSVVQLSVVCYTTFLVAHLLDIK